MELKSYQKNVINDLKLYLSQLNKDNDMNAAWQNYWNKKEIRVGFGGVPTYNNEISGVPHVCMKVPTGGGKTFMACASVKEIYNKMPENLHKVVVWLVPSESILTQTIKTLSDINHPYRQRLNADFAGRVGIYTKEDLLNGNNFSPDTVREMLTVCVLSYSSLRIDSKKKDVRKVYQENGNLYQFAEYFGDDTDNLLDNTPDTALIQTLRHLAPVVIVDESHNAGSDLSVEMINNLNPTFVLDLTATPRKNSNIISYVDARELKKEHMVKLPVIVYNRNTVKNVIEDAVNLRNVLEKNALEAEKIDGKYIRPIVLFQAQPNNKDDSQTFDKIKNILINNGIPKEQIAIKTSKINELDKVELLSKECNVRYIITVNALKEGWDCPFAYVLASLANKNSKVDVEQILGRVLRQPNAKKSSCAFLNTSYVLSCSKDFNKTLENIVKGLNKAGFSSKDYRTQIEDVEVNHYLNKENPTVDLSTVKNENDSSIDDLDIEVLQINIPSENTLSKEATSVVEQMIHQAETQSTSYEKESSEADMFGFIGGELGGMVKQYPIQSQYREEVSTLKIPQFFIESVPDLFGEDYVLLNKNTLLKGFKLNEQDAIINFSLSTNDVYTVDLSEKGEAVPKYRLLSQKEGKYLKEVLAKLAPEEQVDFCAQRICDIVNKDKTLETSEVEAYVHRVIEHMSEDELNVIETSIYTYANKIRDKIKQLQCDYMERQFYRLVDIGKIICKGNYYFPKVITPTVSTSSIPLSLYEAEYNDANGFEMYVRDVIASCENIKWWHRVRDRKGFCINGFIHHFPDFIAMTKSGKVLLIESKGDDRDNSNSRKKLKLGKKWADLAGINYRYFMVFESIEIENAYNLEDFAELLKNIE